MSVKKIRGLLWMDTAAVLLTVSCAWADSYQLSIRLPQAGELMEESPPDHWQITYPDRTGRLVSRQVAAGSGFTVQFPKEIPIVLTARPVAKAWPPGFACRPAGILKTAEAIPASESVVNLTLNWQDGYAADLLLSLAASGVSPSRIGTTRLADAIRRRAGSTPWDLDSGKLIDDLVSGGLWFYSIRLREQVRVILPLPPGTWYSAYPPDPPYVSGPDGWSGTLAPGYHTFLRESDMTVAFVQVNKEGEATVQTR